MDEKDFNSRVTAEVAAERMQKIYLCLEDEATPHAMRVNKCRPYARRVTIYCDAENAAYFKNMLDNEIQAEI